LHMRYAYLKDTYASVVSSSTIINIRG
jgi:hypothetical protein